MGLVAQNLNAYMSEISRRKAVRPRYSFVDSRCQRRNSVVQVSIEIYQNEQGSLDEHKSESSSLLIQVGALIIGKKHIPSNINDRGEILQSAAETVNRESGRDTAAIWLIRNRRRRRRRSSTVHSRRAWPGDAKK